MDHARKQIRDAVAAAVTGLSLTASRVYIGRTRPLKVDHQPSILIFTPAETSGRDAHGRPPILARQLTLHIEIRVQAADPPDDTLDAIAAEVETAMANDIGLAGRLRNVQFVDTQIVINAEGDRHIGGARLEYRLTYRTLEGEPRSIVA